MVYLTGMAYVILAHLLYLLTSILLFNLLEIGYVQLVKAGLIVFMSKIRDMILKSCHYLHDLMNKLIKQFCRLINSIFAIIKAKLLFYLKHVESLIDLDMTLLYLHMKLFREMLSELQTVVVKYIQILENVKEFLTTLITLLSKIQILGTIVSVISPFNKIITKLYDKFTYENDKISKTLRLLYSINLEKTVELTRGKNAEIVVNLKMNLENLLKNSSDIITMKIDHSTISKFQKGVESIKKIKKILDMADIVLLKEIMSIIVKLEVLEIINLPKLYISMKAIQSLHSIILARVYLLVCTILFYNEIASIIFDLSRSLKFNCSNPSQFLAKCSEVEKYFKTVSKSINECIKKLAGIDNKYKIKKFEKLKEVLLNLIGIILRLKFYVDLMAMEILIFKMIILNLIVMAVSSVFIDGLIFYIFTINNVDSAIKTLRECHGYRAFYFIQLKNTLVIFGLSNALKFSQYIHGYYDVLVINLYWINRLIWAIECYINHLIVFSYVSKGLNSLTKHIVDQLKIITQIDSVVKAMETIANKLNSIKNSMKKLNDIQDNMDITKWKESSAKIRHETLSVSRQIGEINSQIDLITEYLGSIYESWPTLVYIYYFLLVLISQVYISIIYIDKYTTLETSIGNDYYTGVVTSVLGPCNKQIKFIFGYLLLMWLSVSNLINIVQNTMLVIYGMMGWLYGLTTVLKEDVDKINKGVVHMECAIEGVVLNLIRCSTKQVSMNIGALDINKTVVGMYYVLIVNQYNFLLNRMLEFWTFSDQSVELFKYIRFCLCALGFESKYRDQRPSTFPYPLHSVKTRDINPVSELDRDTMAENVGNHLCLCLVIKYHLRPTLLKCILYLRNEELGTLDTISRKYDNYNSWSGLHRDLWNLFAFVLNNIYELTSFLRNRYTDVQTRKNDSLLYELYNLFTFLANVAHDITYPLHQGIIANLSRCFCMYSNDPDNHYIISTILFVSSLIENIWSMDSESISMAIQKLSCLVAEYHSMGYYPHIPNLSSDANNNSTSNANITSSLSMTLNQYIKTISVKAQKENGACNANGESSMVLHTQINRSELLLLNTGVKSFFKTILSSLSILIATPLFSLIYSNISGLSFYIIGNKPIIGFSSIFMRRVVNSISVKYLECPKKEQECTCLKNNGCKVCIVFKINYLTLSITVKVLRYVLSTVIIDLITKSKSFNVIITDMNRISINKTELILRRTKNNLLTHLNYDISVNPLNTVKSRNWGYDTLYEHPVTSNTKDGYPNITIIDRTGYRNGGSAKMFKMIYINLIIL